MTQTVTAPRARKSFSRLKHVLDLPNLIDIQRQSFDWFLSEGLRETIDDISPIEDYTGSLAVEFGDYRFGEPQFSIQECREKDLTYQAPLSMTVRFVNKDTGEIREQTVFMGDFPMMTEWGTFIINGTERVIVTQLVRSPGAYLMEPKDATKQVFIANLMPSRGSWLELEIDKKGVAYARIDRKRKLPITTLLRALPNEDPETGFVLDTSTNEAILALFNDSIFIRNTLEKDTTTREEEALIEVFKKQRPGEPPTLDNARNLLRTLFFDPKRYDLTKVGRYKLNQRLGVDVPEGCRVLTTQDILALVQKLISLPHTLGVPEDSKDYAADAISLNRDPIRAELDEYEHFGNRRLRTTGELIQEAFRVGLYRMERVVRERMTTEDVDTITPQTIINIRPVVAALKEFFGSSQLSQFMQQTNSLDGLTHRRRLSALGAGGLTRERAPIEVRDVHPTHYGRMCPIETPEGPNIGLIGSLASMATVSEFGFIQTPYRKVVKGRVTDEIIYLDAAEEAQYTIAQASEPVDEKTGKFEHEQVLCRSREGEAVMVVPDEIEYMDVSPAQIVSVATAMIPFLEHNDANRALMGANMQRQAVPLMIPQAPLVGTGLEYRAAVDSGDVVVAKNAGEIIELDATHIVIEGKGSRDEYDLTKFMRSNQGTLIHHKPIVRLGDKVQAGAVLADGSSTDHGELALGANLLVAFMPFEGYNFEDAIVISERLVKDEVLTSIHIHEYEIDARSTKLGDEEITRDIPNRSEESLRNLDDRGIVRVGAEVGSGDLLVGKVTPKGETELTAEEKLIRAIFKEKAREVRDTSLKVPHGEGGVVIDVKTFSRNDGDRGLQKQRPGEPPTLDNARNLLRTLFFDPKRYDLTKVGRYKLNQRLGVDVPEGVPRADDAGHPGARPEADLAAAPARGARGLEGLRRRRDLAEARPDPGRARRVRALRQPSPAHDRRVDPGGVPCRSIPHGARRPRADDDRGRGHDHAADDHQHPAGGCGAEGVLRLLAALAVHAADELARRPDAPPAAECSRRRRPDKGARSDRGARRAPDPLRPHVPDRDAGRPEHRPDRLARVDGDRVRVRLHPDAVPEGREAGRSATRSSISTPPRRPSTRSRRPRSRSTRRRASSSTSRCSAARARARP